MNEDDILCNSRKEDEIIECTQDWNKFDDSVNVEDLLV